jgi:F-type H+-transporting ATPase subunit epsilon
MEHELHLRVVTPDRTIIDRKVKGVTFEGVDGGYGILPMHAPLMTAVSATGTVTVTELDGSAESMFVSDGFAQVQNNVLTLVCEAGELAIEIDLERAREQEAAARKRMEGLDRLSEEFLKAEASLRKALAREMLARKHSGTGAVR